MNWDSLATTASGITLVVAGIIFTVQRAVKKWGTEDPQPELLPTKIITTDSVALQQLARGLEAINLSIIAIKTLLEGEIAIRREERELSNERDRKAEVRAIARQEVEEANRHADEEDDRRRPQRRPPHRTDPT